jgi:putative membrane protein
MPPPVWTRSVGPPRAAQTIGDIVFTTALAAPLAATAVATHYVGPWAGPWWLFFLIPLFWFLVIAALFAIFGRRRRAAWASDRREGASRGAESTLAERFAQGDIDEVEYRARLEVLRANRSPA